MESDYPSHIIDGKWINGLISPTTFTVLRRFQDRRRWIKSHLGLTRLLFRLSVNPGAQLSAPGVRAQVSLSGCVHVRTGLSDGLHADSRESRLWGVPGGSGTPLAALQLANPSSTASRTYRLNVPTR